MAKRRTESASARPVVAQREETRVQNFVKDERHTRVCSLCEFFEPGEPGYCFRYPQLVAKKPEMRACGEFSER